MKWSTLPVVVTAAVAMAATAATAVVEVDDENRVEWQQ